MPFSDILGYDGRKWTEPVPSIYSCDTLALNSGECFDLGMKIEKLPSDSYLIRKIYNEKMHTVIFDYEPTQKEAMQAMASELGKVQEKHNSMTFKSACD